MSRVKLQVALDQASEILSLMPDRISVHEQWVEWDSLTFRVIESEAGIELAEEFHKVGQGTIPPPKHIDVDERMGGQIVILLELLDGVENVE